MDSTQLCVLPVRKIRKRRDQRETVHGYTRILTWLAMRDTFG
jgi:hypothetical protein